MSGGSICLDFDTPFLLVNRPGQTEGGSGAPRSGVCVGLVGGCFVFCSFLYGTNQMTLYVCILYGVLMSCNILGYSYLVIGSPFV